jgi:hypothetical protein
LLVKGPNDIVPLSARFYRCNLRLLIVGDTRKVPGRDQDSILDAGMALIGRMASALDGELYVWVLVEDLDGSGYLLCRLRQHETGGLGITQGGRPVRVHLGVVVLGEVVAPDAVRDCGGDLLACCFC